MMRLKFVSTDLRPHPYETFVIHYVFEQGSPCPRLSVDRLTYSWQHCWDEETLKSISEREGIPLGILREWAIDCGASISLGDLFNLDSRVDHSRSHSFILNRSHYVPGFESDNNRHLMFRFSRLAQVDKARCAFCSLCDHGPLAGRSFLCICTDFETRRVIEAQLVSMS